MLYSIKHFTLFHYFLLQKKQEKEKKKRNIENKKVGYELLEKNVNLLKILPSFWKIFFVSFFTQIEANFIPWNESSLRSQDNVDFK